MEEIFLSPDHWDIYQVESVRVGYLQGRTKRCVDLVGAIIGLVFGLPIIAVAAIIVKYVDKVPIIFSHQRLGLFGNPFTLYKLKTLFINEKASMLTTGQIERKPIKHPSLTRTGLFWRVTSIDEIPQFWNVILGNMSLVGYRPFPFDYTSRLKELPGMDDRKVEKYLRIIAEFKPGVTSLSSVRGRANLALQQKMEYDMIYSVQASLWYDLSILFRTLVVVITREGAR